MSENLMKPISSEDIFKEVKEVFGNEEIDVIYRKGNPGKSKAELEEMRKRGEMVAFNFCAKLNPRTYEALPNIICEQDVAVLLRDGTRIYCDIYRPNNSTDKVPVIVSWSPFGKRPQEGKDDWKLMGVPPGTVSKTAKFESPDPGYWCYHGYAVANVDPRGVGNSEGDVSNYGLQDGRDGYDFTEWIAVQDWCNGNVGFSGNSGVAMTQWKIAAEQPPHLACIAPWEGTGDMYRESLCPGGIPSPLVNEALCKGIAANQFVEDCGAMIKKYPYMNNYWESKIPRWNLIKVPAYVAAGWCHFHLQGSIDGFRRIRSPKKWLRIHRDFEWPDAYNAENLRDLKRFFDRYLKGIHNGWEMTPRIRLDVMDAFGYDFMTKRVEEEFPLKRTIYKKIYLDAKSQACSNTPYNEPSEISYDPGKEILTFDYKFVEETEITGYMKLHLWVECRGHDNMDLFVWIKKLGQNGEYIPIHSMKEPYRGAWGYLRVSRRELDEKLSTDYQPILAHRQDLKLTPGEIVPVDIGIWPHSRMWHKGESLRVEIEGHFIQSDWFEDTKMMFVTDNGKGKHVIHTGGEYESYLQIPTVPPKYKSGYYILR